MSLKT